MRKSSDYVSLNLMGTPAAIAFKNLEMKSIFMLNW